MFLSRNGFKKLEYSHTEIILTEKKQTAPKPEEVVQEKKISQKKPKKQKLM